MEYKVSDVVKIISGGTPRRNVKEYWSGKIPWLSVKDFNNDNRLVYETNEQITEEGLKHSSATLVKKGTVIISARGTVGELCQVSRDMTFNQSCFGLEAIEKYTTNEYVYYWFKYKTNYIKSNTHGSVFDTINRKTFENLSIELPIIEYQKRVVKILKSIDDKIELNRNIITNLEELSQTLFKRWFVDFEFPDEDGNPYQSSGGEMIESELGEIPQGWEIVQLDDIAEVMMGQSPKSNTYNIQKEGLPLLNGATDFKNRNIKPTKYTTDPKRVGQCGDFVFGVRATIGLVTELDKDYAIGRGAGVVKVNSTAKEWMYEVLVKAFQHFEKSISGSIYINVSSNDLKKHKIIYPPEKYIQKYHCYLVSHFDLIKSIKFQITQLTELRDTLLPKLMSGELEILDEMGVDGDALSI